MSNLTTHELDSPPWLRVESTLMATARLVRVAFDTRLAPLDLNLTQASLLGYVAEFGATTQTDLADHLGIGRAQIGHQITGRQHVSDVGGGQRLTIVFQNLRPAFHASGGERDVSGYDHIACAAALRNPHIRDIGTIRHDYRLYQGVLRRAQPPV